LPRSPFQPEYRSSGSNILKSSSASLKFDCSDRCGQANLGPCWGTKSPS
jgi:hypothetical protein